MGLSGKEGLQLCSSDPFFLVDECLSKHIAKALKLVGYNVGSVEDVFPGRRGRPVTDEEIIDWLGRQRLGVWVTADHSARRQRREQLLFWRVSAIWVKWPKRGMTARRQHRLLSYVIDPISEEVRASHEPVYFLAYYNGDRPSRMKV